MGERLTKRDIEKIEEEIEHRKLVIRKDTFKKQHQFFQTLTS